MTSPLLVKARRDGREIVDITPERAGWTHVGFRALRLHPGEVESLDTGERELCLVVLAGKVDVQVGDELFAKLGTRTQVFDDHAPDALYVPSSRRVTITATTSAEIALCTAPCDHTPREIKRLDPAAMRRSTRGQGSNTRFICDVLPHDDPTAAHLLVVEVRTPAGHSSSYPPHKHDSETPPIETQLEETYYHRLNPPQGFAFQRVYTDDRSLDESMAVEDHDVVMVPRGYHPVVVPHGYDSYYLNVMAGPKRLWVFRNDPAHEWMSGLTERPTGALHATALTRSIVLEHWALANARRWDEFKALLHPDLRYEVPQTREYIESAEGYFEMFRTWPGDWKATVTHLVCEGRKAVCAIDFAVDNDVMTGVSIFTLSGDKIVEAIDYWPESYEPPPRATLWLKRRPK